MKRQNNLRYRFYATLLDSFQGYLDSSRIYRKYWGSSESPPMTEEEFEAQQLQSFFDRVNRVPFDSEPADRGTCFNEVVDCLIENRRSDKMKITSDNTTGLITAQYNNRSFAFRTQDCRGAAARYKGALTQMFVKGIITTAHGDVELYGYLDELLPDSIVDIKTTGRNYSAFSYSHNWQHRVYPFCLRQEGIVADEFHYDIYVLGKDNQVSGYYRESYTFNAGRDEADLVDMCERMIDTLELNRHLITDTKIFNEL